MMELPAAIIVISAEERDGVYNLDAL